MAIVPGWHGTIFAPYFVAGAIFSGFAMVLTLMIPLRKIFKLEHSSPNTTSTTWRSSSSSTARSWSTPTGWSTSSPGTAAIPSSRRPSGGGRSGPYWWAGWTMIICNALVSQSSGSGRFAPTSRRCSSISIFINIGMWFERFVIISSSLSNDFVPYAWGKINPSWADWGILVGSFGWFRHVLPAVLPNLPDGGDSGGQGDDPHAARSARGGGAY